MNDYDDYEGFVEVDHDGYEGFVEVDYDSDAFDAWAVQDFLG